MKKKKSKKVKIEKKFKKKTIYLPIRSNFILPSPSFFSIFFHHFSFQIHSLKKNWKKKKKKNWEEMRQRNTDKYPSETMETLNSLKNTKEFMENILISYYNFLFKKEVIKQI